MSVIVCGINLPLVVSAVMGSFQHAIRGQVPHLRVSIVEILFHAEVRFLGLIFSIFHVLELNERFLNRSVPVNAWPWLPLLLSSVNLDFLL